MALFGLALLVFLGIYWTVVPARARRLTFGLVSLAALAVYAPASVAILGALTIATYVLLAGDRLGPGRTGVVVLLCLAILAIHKYASLPWPRLLGVSYAVFRLIHVALDVGRGALRIGSLPSLLEYALFPPSFLSGPIERYGDFEGGRDTAAIDLDRAFWGTRRILFGLSKKVFMADPLGAASQRAFALAPASAGEAWGALIGYSLFIYLDFSAYCDIALGVARLFGFRLSENFDWPYLATDITDFWRRWHMTLTSWLRDYVFVPLSVRLNQAPSLRPRPLLASSLAAVVTMLACGIWHGETVSFVLWGLGHGLLLAGHQVYRQRVLGGLTPKQRKTLATNKPYQWACGGFTFLAVSLLWLLFRFTPAEAGAYTLRLFGWS